jgi:hypothetical protein
MIVVLLYLQETYHSIGSLDLRPETSSALIQMLNAAARHNRVLTLAHHLHVVLVGRIILGRRHFQGTRGMNAAKSHGSHAHTALISPNVGADCGTILQEFISCSLWYACHSAVWKPIRWNPFMVQVIMRLCACHTRSPENSLRRQSIGWCVNGMHTSMATVTIHNGPTLSTWTICEWVSFQIAS